MCLTSHRPSTVGPENSPSPWAEMRPGGSQNVGHLGRVGTPECGAQGDWVTGSQGFPGL